MSQVDRITEIRICGFKAISDIHLKLDGLTVLIGDNGSGKSSILEAIEILSRAANRSFVADVISRQHGGIDSLLRSGESELTISATIESDSRPKIEYSISIGKQGNYPFVSREQLDVKSDPNATRPLAAISGGSQKVSLDETPVITRTRDQCHVFDIHSQRLIPFNSSPGETTLSSFGEISQPTIQRVLSCLNSTRVFLPFDTRASWLAAEQNITPPLRTAVAIMRTDTLDRLGSNLANCYQTLRHSSRTKLDELLDKLRLGLGSDLEDFQTPAAARGQIEFHLKFRSFPQTIPASSLSDGQLSFLAFVALSELSRGQGLMCFDEPESHLHPNLLARLVWEFEAMAKESPILISTHSDRFLDSLSNPANSVVLCELNEQRAVTLLRPDPQKKVTDWISANPR